MKSTKCPNCGFRNFTENPRCSSCNELLVKIGAGNNNQSPSPQKKSNASGNTLSSPQGPPPPPAPIPFSAVNPLSNTSPSPVNSPVPYQPIPLQNTGQSNQIISPPNPLPTYMTKQGPSTVEGVVVDMGQMQNVDRSIKAGDILHLGLSSVLLVTKPIYGIMSFASGARRAKEYNNIHTFRIETPEHEFVDIQVEKDLIGASINLRDYVSIWGKDAGGVIILYYGYNHTVKGQIRLR